MNIYQYFLILYTVLYLINMYMLNKHWDELFDEDATEVENWCRYIGIFITSPLLFALILVPTDINNAYKRLKRRYWLKKRYRAHNKFIKTYNKYKK